MSHAFAVAKDDDLLTIDDAAKILKVSRSTLKKWIQRKRIPTIRPGKAHLIARADLDRFVAASRRG